jgi:D-alanyl-D-alanine carboxypeptidase
VRSRGPVLLALAAVGALVGVLVNAFFVDGSGATRPQPPVGTTTGAVLAEISPSTATGEEQAPAAAAKLVYADDAFRPITPKLSAVAYVAIDAESGKVIAARQDRRPLPIASLTKVMTALLVIEDGDLDKKVRVPKAATLVEPNREGLRAKHWYKRRLLLYSAMLVSANDSADALAYAAGGGKIKRFYARMNERAKELGMTATVYASASGLEDDENVSSAFDQALLARFALENRTFARIVGTRRKVVKWPPPTYAKEWINHNRMLVTYEGAYGVKTGYTSKAGGCLIVAARRNGHDVIGVVLGSKNIWRDMPILLDAAFERLARE